jgi:hypothetical protein
LKRTYNYSVIIPHKRKFGGIEESSSGRLVGWLVCLWHQLRLQFSRYWLQTLNISSCVDLRDIYFFLDDQSIICWRGARFNKILWLEKLPFLLQITNRYCFLQNLTIWCEFYREIHTLGCRLLNLRTLFKDRRHLSEGTFSGARTILYLWVPVLYCCIIIFREGLIFAYFALGTQREI